MPREVDLRDQNEYVSFTLGADDLPVGAQQLSGTLAEKALAVAGFTTDVLGAQQTGPIEFEAELTSPSSQFGATSVHLQQQLHGIPVAFGNQVVRFGNEGQVQRTQARLAVSAADTVAVPVTAEAAAVAAVRHLESTESDSSTQPDAYGQVSSAPMVDFGSFSAQVLARFPNLASQPTVLEKGPFAEPITAHLTWVPTSKRLRLCWDLMIVVSEFEGAFRFLVSADDASVLYCTQVVASAAQGNVFDVNPRSSRKLVRFPRPWLDYGALSVAGVPPDPPPWVETNSTSGYSATAAVGANGSPVMGSASGGSVVFNPSDAMSREQMVINAFYGTCSMHDFFYLLGFREQDGSYQQGGVSSGGLPCMRIKAEVRTDEVMGSAHWWPHGTSPALRLGPKRETGRSTALDMTIVCHEYMHAVTSRTVGRGTTANPFLEPQSRGMAEGWGDYVAVTITGEPLIGGWITDGRGMRSFPYDKDFPVGSRNFGILSSLKQYEIGELWCATLLEMNRRIGSKLGLHLVVDSLRHLEKNPSLLNGRNAILDSLSNRRDGGALTEEEYDAAKLGVWRAFAKFGMGAGAASHGPTLSGVKADFAVPSM